MHPQGRHSMRHRTPLHALPIRQSSRVGRTRFLHRPGCLLDPRPSFLSADWVTSVLSGQPAWGCRCVSQPHCRVNWLLAVNLRVADLTGSVSLWPD